MTRPIIEVRHISKCYRLGQFNARSLREEAERLFSRRRNGKANGDESEFWALQDVSFTVAPGEVLGIIGRNGAGKSTLLKILSRVTEPTSGEILIRGRVASLLEVGTGFHPELTGRENIYLNGAMLGMTRAEIRGKFDEIVAFAEVERFLDTPVKRYSSGMYVRLAFAVAAHLEPEILVIDEVLAVGDAAFQKKSVGKMQTIASEQGRTILFVSHNTALIQSLCDRGIVLTAGAITADSDPAEAVQIYLRNGPTYTEGQETDLRDHLNRLPGMKKCLQSIRVLSLNGSPAYSLAQGDPFEIEVTYDASAHCDSLAGAGFIVKSQSGAQVAGFNTYMSSPPPHRIPARGSVRFKISGPPLNPGHYLLTCSLGDHQSHLVDKVEDCLSFEIRQFDLYGTGYLLTTQDGVVALNCEAISA